MQVYFEKRQPPPRAKPVNDKEAEKAEKQEAQSEVEYIVFTGLGTGDDVLARPATDEDKEMYADAYKKMGSEDSVLDAEAAGAPNTSLGGAQLGSSKR